MGLQKAQIGSKNASRQPEMVFDGSDPCHAGLIYLVLHRGHEHVLKIKRPSHFGLFWTHLRPQLNL